GTGRSACRAGVRRDAAQRPLGLADLVRLRVQPDALGRAVARLGDAVEGEQPPLVALLAGLQQRAAVAVQRGAVAGPRLGGHALKLVAHGLPLVVGHWASRMPATTRLLQARSRSRRPSACTPATGERPRMPAVVDG